MAEIIQFVGYHGTSKNNANAILVDGYKLSEGYSHWIGDGVYMFLDGISDGLQNAIDWAIVKSWNNNTRHTIYPFYAVLKSTIQVEEDKFLDLTTRDGVEVFEYISSKCSDKLAEIRKDVKYIDGYVVNFGREELKLPLDVVKTNEYIKLKKEARLRKYLRRKTPNCTICAIYDIATIKESVIQEKGRIQQ